MKTVTRLRGQLAGEYTVYDNAGEARAAGITTVLPFNTMGLRVGDWVIYPNGRIAQVIKTTAESTYIYTPLNLYRPQAVKGVDGVFKEYRLGPSIYDISKISPPLVKFAEDWLLRGESLEKSVTQNLWKYNRNRSSAPTPYSARSYGYMILSGAWFDELLKTNRLIRDKYMSIVGAFDEAGITPEYLAKKIKEGIDSEDTRRHINALNKAIEVVEAEANRRKGKPVFPATQPAQFSDVPAKQISESTGSVLDRIQIPKEHQNVQTERSASSAPEGNSPIQAQSPDPREVGGNGKTEGNKAVSPESPDWSGVSIAEQVVSTEKV